MTISSRLAATGAILFTIAFVWIQLSPRKVSNTVGALQGALSLLGLSLFVGGMLWAVWE